jgi:hypothetical protein
MHQACYEQWLVEQDDVARMKSKLRNAVSAVVVLPGEEGLACCEIGRRQTRQFFGENKQQGGDGSK